VRLILTIVTIFCLTLACFRDCVILFSFSLFRPYIAKNLCEQRDLPGNTCQGCCQLKKQLGSDESTDRKPPAGLPKESEDLQPITLSSALLLHTQWLGQAVSSSDRVEIPLPLGEDIDHPPNLILL